MKECPLINLIMKFRRKYTITSAVVFALIFLSANIYFVQILFEEKQVHTFKNVRTEVTNSSKERTPKPKKPLVKHGTIIAIEKIKYKLSQLSSRYYRRKSSSYSLIKQLQDDLNETVPISINLLQTADEWATPNQLVPNPAPVLGSLLRTLCTSQIRKAENARKGTQLKLLLTFDSGWQGVFKPQWYERNEVLWGPSYGGKDRHNGEVASFHLSLLLGLPRVPITVGRRLHLPLEILPVADQALHNTFSLNGSSTCLHGVCLYCTPKEPVCGKTLDGKNGGPYLEGALSLWLPSKLLPLKRHRSPWQRTYKPGRAAKWEVDKDYCVKIMQDQENQIFREKLLARSRLLDLIDAAIFDFLIGNGDRHHHETFQPFPNSTVLLIDNGKSFGNPYDDHLDILAPLYQCCIIRRKTWERLQILSGGVLGEALEILLRPSHLSPLLTPPHYVALNRRLLHVYATVENCLDKDQTNVILDLI
ncbi:hypothetical protein J437_LFUL000428 [Ladona fulva]|uniref:FAM20 C-terminal domain-containing protein n=1 Tax=Ladona fulva TaxID=123851 RepID=A0A8K0P184_LADFU|nr:hypothetical protein J437_LFUL000428 [Ladona fulva]